MKRIMCLAALARLSESTEKNALKGMVEIRERKTIEQQRLDQLVEFRDRYIENCYRCEKAGITGSGILEMRTFIEKLIAAVEDQERRISGLETQLESQSTAWSQCRHRRSGFEKLIRKEFNQAIRNQEKHDQFEINDRTGPTKDTFDGTDSA